MESRIVSEELTMSCNILYQYIMNWVLPHKVSLLAKTMQIVRYKGLV